MASGLFSNIGIDNNAKRPNCADTFQDVLRSWPFAGQLSPVAALSVAIVVSAMLLFGCQPVRPSSPLQSPDAPWLIVRIYFANVAELNQMAAELDIWEVHRPAGFVVARVRSDQLQMLQQQGMHVELDCAKMTQLQKALGLSATVLDALCPA